MSKFSDLLGKPLPSVSTKLFNNFLESDDDNIPDVKDSDLKDIDKDIDVQDDSTKEEGCAPGEEGCGARGTVPGEECGPNGCAPGSECGPNGCAPGEECGDSDAAAIASDVSDDDIDDIDDMSDEELAALDSELLDDQYNAFAGDEDEVTLTPAEQEEADDMMGIAATTVLVNDELNKDEKKKFIESTSDVKAAINEGLLLESDINEMAATLGLVTENNNYNKKMIIRLDREAKQKQLYAIAVNVSAAAHNDPQYRQLKKLNRMRKILRAKLDKKYHSEATRRMRVYYKRLVSSNSAPLAAIGKGLEKYESASTFSESYFKGYSEDELDDFRKYSGKDDNKGMDDIRRATYKFSDRELRNMLDVVGRLLRRSDSRDECHQKYQSDKKFLERELDDRRHS